MRSLKPLLVYAGNFKRQYPNLNEEQIIIRSMEMLNIPKFIEKDVDLFNGILRDLFP